MVSAECRLVIKKGSKGDGYTQRTGGQQTRGNNPRISIKRNEPFQLSHRNIHVLYDTAGDAQTCTVTMKARCISRMHAW